MSGSDHGRQPEVGMKQMEWAKDDARGSVVAVAALAALQTNTGLHHCGTTLQSAID